MEEGKINIVVKLKHEQWKSHEAPKLHIVVPALPAQNIVCISDESDNFWNYVSLHSSLTFFCFENAKIWVGLTMTLPMYEMKIRVNKAII